jgi:3-hydroxyisobutyrate dehydrogenase/2-hydroxy-3-oxopropionate reductase
MANLAFLGLGAMGAPMASRLIAAGHAVTVWNRTRARAEALAGAARVAASPADATRDVDAVITMLATPDVLTEVLSGADGLAAGMTPRTPLIEMSTIGPDCVTELADLLPEGVEVIDVPVMGGVKDAVEGTLKLYFGASAASFERWKEALAPLGEPVHIGPPGAGAALKLVANSTLAGLMGLIGEALALADGYGLDEKIATAALLDSPIGPALKRKIDKIESGHYAASFKLDLMHKDMRLVMDTAARRGVDLRVVEGATRWVASAAEHGRGNCDYSAVVAEIRGRPATC